MQEALRVLDLRGKKPEDLSGLLAPLLVQSAEQQQVFDEVFDQWLKLHIRPEEKEDEPIPEVIEQDRRRWRIPLFAALTVLAVLVVAYFVRPKPEPQPLPDPAFSLSANCLAPGDTVRGVFAMGENPDTSLQFQWRMDGEVVGENAPNLALLMAKPGLHHLDLTIRRDSADTTRTRSFFVHGSVRPEARIDTLKRDSIYTFIAGNQQEGWRYRWDFGNGDTASGPRVTREMAAGQQHTIRLEVSLADDIAGFCSDQSTLLLDLREILVELPPLEPIRIGAEELPHAWRLYTWLAWPLLCLLGFLAWGFWRRYRRRLPDDPAFERALKPANGPPIELDFPRQNDHLGDGPALSELARMLRQREHSERKDLDLRATLQATIREGGFPSLRYRQQERPVEYLALVEMQGPHDQQSQLIGAMLDRLRSEEVPIQTWYYEGSPRYCYQPGQEEPVPLSRLAQRFAGYRLMIFGRASGLLDARNSALRKGLADLLPLWDERALLTPLPVADWGRAEARLSQHLILLPADLAGQAALVEAWDDRDPPDFRTLQRQLLIERPEAEALMDYDLTQIADLKEFLGERRFRWVAAAALYPRPVWEITLAVAARLNTVLPLAPSPDATNSRTRGKEENTAFSSPPQEGAGGRTDQSPFFSSEGAGGRNPGLSYHDLLHLTQIPWLQDGDLSETLRAQLLAELDDDTRQQARQALLDLLSEADAPLDSHAARERDVQRAIQRAELDFGNPRQQEALRVMLAQGLLDPAMRERVRNLPSEEEQQSELTGIFLWLDRLLDRVEASAAQGRERAEEVLKKNLSSQAERIEKRSSRANTLEVIMALRRLLYFTHRHRRAALTLWLALLGVLALYLLPPQREYGGLARAETYKFSEYINAAADAIDQQNYSEAERQLALAEPLADGRPSFAYQQALLEYRRGRQAYQLRQWNSAAARFNAAKQAPRELGLGDTLQQHALHAQGLVFWYQGNTALAELNRDSLSYSFIQGFGEPNLVTLMSGEGDSLILGGQLTTAVPSAQPITLSGQLLDAETSQPVSGGNVVIANWRLIVEPDAQGRFSASIDPSAVLFGRVLVEVQLLAGYEDYQLSLPLRRDTSITIRLQPEQEDILLPTMIPIPGGSFMMGSEEIGVTPIHQVQVSTFYMAETEVTVGQYLAFCRATDTHWPEWLEEGNEYHVETGTDPYYKNVGYQREGSENLPIVGVSWDDATAYCQWLSEETGQRYRLPTEAEWEYAAGGGDTLRTTYAGINSESELGQYAWYSANSNSQPQPVRQKRPNRLGLYDMSGNVWEWCADWYGDYPSEPQTNPQGPAEGSFRVLRGGSWKFSARHCRVAGRDGYYPTYRNTGLGFRLAR